MKRTTHHMRPWATWSSDRYSGPLGKGGSRQQNIFKVPSNLKHSMKKGCCMDRSWPVHHLVQFMAEGWGGKKSYVDSWIEDIYGFVKSEEYFLSKSKTIAVRLLWTCVRLFIYCEIRFYWLKITSGQSWEEGERLKEAADVVVHRSCWEANWQYPLSWKCLCPVRPAFPGQCLAIFRVWSLQQ